MTYKEPQASSHSIHSCIITPASNNCATMAKRSLGDEPVVLLIMAMVVLAALPPEADANMDVFFYNNLKNKVVMVHCYSNVQSNIPAQLFGSAQRVRAFSLPDKGGDLKNRNWGGTRYWCEFQVYGKPTTYINVFVGTGGSSNQPCGCTGWNCHWTINEEGLSCEPSGYFQKWG